jgi:hypothetical protein
MKTAVVQIKRKPKPRTYQKKLSLHPMSFEQVMDTVLKYKPKSKKKTAKQFKLSRQA